MTTIAIKDGIVAADTRETWTGVESGISVAKCQKIFKKTLHRPNPNDGNVQDPYEIIIATAGDSFSGMVFYDWYDGSAKELPTALCNVEYEEDFIACIVRPDGLFMVNRLCRPLKVLDNFTSLGSGSKSALAVMLLGYSARKAVEISSKVDPYTGPEVETVSIRELKGWTNEERKNLGLKQHYNKKSNKSSQPSTETQPES